MADESKVTPSLREDFREWRKDFPGELTEIFIETLVNHSDDGAGSKGSGDVGAGAGPNEPSGCR